MRHLRYVLAIFTLSLTICALAQESSPAPSTPASTPSSPSPFEHLRDATQLDRKEAQPFHLRVDVQLYDLNGKPSQTGTIEEWWVSPNEYRIETNSGSFHYVLATGQTNPAAHPDRDSYLLSELWQKVVRPLADMRPAAAPTESKQTIGSTQLDCFTVAPSAALGFNPLQPPSMYCTDSGKQSLRIVRTGFQLLLRNSLGTFHGTEVALSSTILYFAHPAISGKISVLQSFTPGSPGSPALQPDALADAAETTVPVAGAPGVHAGRAIEKANPIYPPPARAAHISGTVLLHAVITKEGRIGSLFVIASPNDSLSAAAMDAVKTWKYEPYLLNGQPIKVDTTVTINFNMSP